MALPLALILVPIPVAAVALGTGLFTTSLALVYLSIAASVLWVPLAVAGVLLLITGSRQQWRFNPPPGWPAPPPDWRPDAGWQPDAAWPTPPRGWTWWTGADAH